MTNPSQEFAASLIAEFVSRGVKNFYLAPGARSQALAIAAGQLAQAGKLSNHASFQNITKSMKIMENLLKSMKIQAFGKPPEYHKINENH